ncbi:hypothetical protein RSSM_04944 [Rhodopirellula sallentina SM41]|uniref:Uncharacterized protein n=1 Tax=Rhodopirellula sallentina SM41 TaxID=1263870 RepID=M5TX35_9BACT|nr:hypothetical protein RSSM_04944 [Rhodopirellula sallentina SM41]
MMMWPGSPDFGGLNSGESSNHDRPVKFQNSLRTHPKNSVDRSFLVTLWNPRLLPIG